MHIILISLILVIFIVAAGSLLIWGISEEVIEGKIGGGLCVIISFALIVWMIMGGRMALDPDKEEFYTPSTLVAEDGSKIQVILVHGDIINVTAMFHQILPEDKIIKRVTWKNEYCGIVYETPEPKFFIIAKAEKAK